MKREVSVSFTYSQIQDLCLLLQPRKIAQNWRLFRNITGKVQKPLSCHISAISGWLPHDLEFIYSYMVFHLSALATFLVQTSRKCSFFLLMLRSSLLLNSKKFYTVSFWTRDSFSFSIKTNQRITRKIQACKIFYKKAKFLFKKPVAFIAWDFLP